MFTAMSTRLANLRASYAEPHRAYHTQAHIDTMLAGLAELGSAGTEPAAAELAVWYHDAIYDPARSDNEARSAALLRTDLAGLAGPVLLDRVELLVRLTAAHRLPEDVPSDVADDAALFLDLDMAILGAPPSEYDVYERGIAAEYEPVHGRARFTAGRAAFLSSMLNRPWIFLTSRCHDALDAPARDNMRRALRHLARA